MSKVSLSCSLLSDSGGVAKGGIWGGGEGGIMGVSLLVEC